MRPVAFLLRAAIGGRDVGEKGVEGCREWLGWRFQIARIM
jgi:hypothetical protein